MPCSCAAAFAMLMSFHSTPGIFEFTQEWREGLVRRKQVCEVAVSGNGSRRIRCEAFDYRWALLPERTFSFDLLLTEGPPFVIAVREAGASPIA